MENLTDFNVIPTDWEKRISTIKVIGVGGGGCNAVNYMFEQLVHRRLIERHSLRFVKLRQRDRAGLLVNSENTAKIMQKQRRTDVSLKIFVLIIISPIKFHISQ